MSLTTCYIDLATFDRIEEWMYVQELDDQETAFSFFQRGIRKRMWFAHCPTKLKIESGNGKFGNEYSFKVPRSGDVLTQAWLRVKVPAVSTTAGTVRWCKDFMHQLVTLATLTFNEITAQKFDTHFLQNFWQHFTDEGKMACYNEMIGNIDALTDASTSLPATILNLPLPFFFSRDTGIGLPVGVLPFNDIRINITNQEVTKLLVLEGTATLTTLGGSYPELTFTELWANMAIVTDDERNRMAEVKRDMLIEQVQTTKRDFSKTADTTIDIRFGYAVKALFWNVRNKTKDYEQTNYTTSTDYTGSDPISTSSLTYENENRLDKMGSDFFSNVSPFYWGVRCPDVTGLHMYSYSVKPNSVDPSGSSGYNKLNNVSITVSPSAAATAASSTIFSAGQLIVNCLSQNIITVERGSVGFPSH